MSADPSTTHPPTEPSRPGRQKAKRWSRFRRGLWISGLLFVGLLASGALAVLGVPPFRAAGMALVARVLPHDVTDGLADLRSAEVVASGDAERERGRRRLSELAERHGADAHARHRTFTAVVTDTWAGDGGWWPSREQKVQLDQLLGTFSSRVTLLDGERAGETWGIQAWHPWWSPAGDGDPRFLAPEEADPRRGAIEFYLPTLHYFDELVFRLADAPLQIDAGETVLDGRTYDLVFVSWGDGRPQDQYDQYVLWIDRETGLLAKAHYTVREAAAYSSPLAADLMRAASAGTIHFSDYREVEGVMVPFEHVVTLFGPAQAKPPLSENYFHRLVVEEAGFDRVAVEDLVPDAKRGRPADRKPDQ